MREVNIGTKKYSRVVCLDKPGAGGACHEYEIVSTGDPRVAAIYGMIHFQNGPIKDAGVNGCHQEDLLAIVIDRLQSFQKGAFACSESAIALSYCEYALHWLRQRTNARVAKGIEGTNTV